MAVFEERSAEIKAAFGQLKSNIGGLKSSYEAKLAEEKARADAAEKKLEAALASAVSSDAFDAWAGQFLEEIKGAMQ